eukprot:14050-Heterococcus_DN1.PRE.2
MASMIASFCAGVAFKPLSVPFAFLYSCSFSAAALLQYNCVSKSAAATTELKTQQDVPAFCAGGAPSPKSAGSDVEVRVRTAWETLPLKVKAEAVLNRRHNNELMACSITIISAKRTAAWKTKSERRTQFSAEGVATGSCTSSAQSG